MKKVTYMLSLVLATVISFSSFTQAQDKKWSPQAKGTVIGAGTGAAAGAIIHKRNRVLGGVVGGVVGGAAGYAIGKRKDNKNKEAARVAAANRAAANRAAAARSTASRASANRAVASNKSAASASQALAAAPAYTNGYVAGGNPELAYAAFLPNPDFGNPNSAYGSSEYRRKSW